MGGQCYCPSLFIEPVSRFSVCPPPVPTEPTDEAGVPLGTVPLGCSGVERPEGARGGLAEENQFSSEPAPEPVAAALPDACRSIPPPAVELDEPMGRDAPVTRGDPVPRAMPMEPEEARPSMPRRLKE